MKASIIIVTRDRAADLKQTLDAMRRVKLADGLNAELLVVDNGSSDGTADVVKSFDLDRIAVRYVCEPSPGQALGRNRGLAETTGEFILFTDDDVRPPSEWLIEMCNPIAEGAADAASGGVQLAPHLLRPWMTPMHRSWLASTEWLGQGEMNSVVGANMAFSRKVLQRVAGFDPELGPGAAGFNDDHLFALQLLAAGYRICNRTDVVVEHHCDPSRLKREAWLNAARRRGASHAYVGHHWEHWRCRCGHLKVAKAAARLAAWRLGHRKEILNEGCSGKELNLAFTLALVRAHVAESKRPRNYERHGLVKLRHSSSST